MTAISTADRLRQLLDKVPREYRKSPVSVADIADLQAFLHSSTGIAVPADYVELLHITDGIQIDNDIISSATDCRFENEDLHNHERYRRYVVIGHEGNVASWAYDCALRRFVICGFPDLDLVFESYASLYDLIESRIS